MQIRTRLTIRFIAIAAGILALALFYVYNAYKQNMEDAFFENLASKAALTRQTTLQQEERLGPLPPVFSGGENDAPLGFRDNVSIFNDAYQCVFSMYPEAEPVATRTLQEVQQMGECRFRHQNLHGLGVAAGAPSGRQYVIVAEGFCDPGPLLDLRNILIFSFLIGIGAVAAGGWYFAGQALSPVMAIMREVEEIGPTDLSRRLNPGKNHDEIARLADTFNGLLDRVEHAFRMQRQFLSNVSHELKNPLTVIRTQLDVTLQRERSAEEYRLALVSVFEDVNVMTDVEEKLLMLARVHTEATQIPMALVRLDELLFSARESVLKNSAERKIMIEFSAMPEEESMLCVRGNESLLRTAFVNLIENGCKYSPDNRVTVRIEFSENGRHVVEIADNGPGIPPEEMALIFEPFYRSPRHLQVKGTGIGLSLTDSILKLHGIERAVLSPKTGGTVFRLVFSS